MRTSLLGREPQLRKQSWLPRAGSGLYYFVPRLMKPEQFRHVQKSVGASDPQILDPSRDLLHAASRPSHLWRTRLGTSGSETRSAMALQGLVRRVEPCSKKGCSSRLCDVVRCLRWSTFRKSFSRTSGMWGKAPARQ